MEVTARKAQANSEQVVFVIFDMERNIRLTLRHGIIMVINETGIKGRILNFIQNFLTPRFSKVKINENLYDTKFQTENIPEGRVVRPTFSYKN